jgi:hypothetical protein
MGGPGGPSSHGRGLGMCPFTPTEVSLFDRGRPAPTLIKAGVEGAQAPSQGVWGMCPQNFRRRGELPTLAHPPRVGPKTLANPQPAGVGKRGVQGGEAPMAGGLEGVPPRNQKRERVAHINKPAASGTRNADKPSARGGGKTGGPGGRSPHGGGFGGCPPTKPKEGASRPH